MNDNATGMSFSACGNLNSTGGGLGKARFPSPYLDYTSTYVWRTLDEVFDWSEFSFLMTPEVREAFRRLVSPFVTPVKFESLDPEHRPLDPGDEKSWQRLIELKLKWPMHAYLTLLNVMFYGNDFISVIAPVDRWLECPDCGTRYRLKELKTEHNFTYSKTGFSLKCGSPSCRYGGLNSKKIFKVVDMRDSRPENFRIKHWSPRHIVIDYYEVPEETKIYWNIPGTIKQAVKRSDVYTLSTLDMGMLRAIDEGKLFEFNKNRVFHASEPTLSGIKNNGWGLPRVTGLHKQAWMLQLLRKSVQSIALDLDHPIKIVHPAPVAQQTMGGAMSPNQAQPVAEFQRNFNRILASHRFDATRWHAMGQPIQSSFLGGQANQLFPSEMINATKEDLVDAAGLPVELYKGNLSAQAAPMGLRLFESQNSFLVSLLNDAVQFTVDRICELSARDPITVSHQPLKLVDDMNTIALLSQLATSGAISLSEPLNRLGVSLRDDMWKQHYEQKLRQEFQQRMEADMMKQQESASLMQQLGAPQEPQMGPDGQPMPPGPPQQMLPSQGFRPPPQLEQWEPAAMSLAEMLSMMPEIQRQQEIRILREQHPTFHAVVMQRLSQIRRQQGTEARAAMMSGPM